MSLFLILKTKRRFAKFCLGVENFSISKNAPGRDTIIMAIPGDLYKQ
jgi:hypothetical protein